MLNRLTQLSFVIGLFFTLVSLILFLNMLFNKATSTLNIYTAVSFFIFGVAMMFVKKRKEV